MDPRLEDYESGDEGLLAEFAREPGGDDIERDLEEFVRAANEHEIDKAIGRDPTRPVPEGAELQEFLSQHLDYERSSSTPAPSVHCLRPSCMKP